MIAALAAHPSQRFADRAAWLAHLEALGLTRLEVTPDLVPFIGGEVKGTLSTVMATELISQRNQIQGQFGFKIPGVRVRANDGDLSNGTYVVLIREVPIVADTVDVHRRFFPGTTSDLSRVGVTGIYGEDGTDRLTGSTGLWLEVKDDGVGLTTAARSRLNAGVGLSNTRDRLECLYGAKHRLDFSEGSNALAVRIEIPFHRAPSGTDAAAPRVA